MTDAERDETLRVLTFMLRYEKPVIRVAIRHAIAAVKREADYDALREAAGKRRNWGHCEGCQNALNRERPCNCGHDALDAALARKDNPRPRAAKETT